MNELFRSTFWRLLVVFGVTAALCLVLFWWRVREDFQRSVRPLLAISLQECARQLAGGQRSVLVGCQEVAVGGPEGLTLQCVATSCQATWRGGGQQVAYGPIYRSSPAWGRIALICVMMGLGLSAATLIVLWPIRRQVGGLLGYMEQFERSFQCGEPLPQGLSMEGPLRGSLESFERIAGRLVDLLREAEVALDLVVHELRTPRARLELALENARYEGGNGEHVEAAVSASEDLGLVIEDVILFHRLLTQRQLPALRTLELGPWLGRWAKAHEVEVVWQRQEGVVAKLRPELIMYALANMVRNTRAHAPGAKVEVVVQVEAGGLSLHVDDDGPGFEPQRHGVVHPGGSTQEDGGIGLLLCAKIASLHGASLRLDASPWGGARVSLVGLAIPGGDPGA